MSAARLRTELLFVLFHGAIRLTGRVCARLRLRCGTVNRPVSRALVTRAPSQYRNVDKNAVLFVAVRDVIGPFGRSLSSRSVVRSVTGVGRISSLSSVVRRRVCARRECEENDSTTSGRGVGEREARCR